LSAAKEAGTALAQKKVVARERALRGGGGRALATKRNVNLLHVQDLEEQRRTKNSTDGDRGGRRRERRQSKG